MHSYNYKTQCILKHQVLVSKKITEKGPLSRTFLVQSYCEILVAKEALMEGNETLIIVLSNMY